MLRAQQEEFLSSMAQLMEQQRALQTQLIEQSQVMGENCKQNDKQIQALSQQVLLIAQQNRNVGDNSQKGDNPVTRSSPPPEGTPSVTPPPLSPQNQHPTLPTSKTPPQTSMNNLGPPPLYHPSNTFTAQYYPQVSNHTQNTNPYTQPNLYHQFQTQGPSPHSNTTPPLNNHFTSAFPPLPFPGPYSYSNNLHQPQNQPTNSRISQETPHLQLRTVRLDFPVFNGEKCTEWLFKVYQFFQHYQIPEHQKLGLASMHMEGKTLIWFQDLANSGISLHLIYNRDLITAYL